MAYNRIVAAIPLVLLLSACAARSPEDSPARPASKAAVSSTPQPVGATSWSRSRTSLPEIRKLEVTVEGQTELRAAMLFESSQGYTIYVLPQVVMTPEEPGQDQAFARVDEGFFLRIHRLPPGADLADQRTNAELALQDIGRVHPVQRAEIFHPFFRDAEFFLRASNADVTVNRLVIAIDGGLYAITMHLPHREAAEGIIPSFWGMLRSIRTLRPFSPPAGRSSGNAAVPSERWPSG